MGELLAGAAPKAEGADISRLGGDFDSAKGLWTLAASMPSYRRRLLHGLADELGLPHLSTGDAASPAGRRLHIARSREVLPGPYFIEGEEVEVIANRRNDPPGRGIVVNA